MLMIVSLGLVTIMAPVLTKLVGLSASVLPDLLDPVVKVTSMSVSQILVLELGLKIVCSLSTITSVIASQDTWVGTVKLRFVLVLKSSMCKFPPSFNLYFKLFYTCLQVNFCESSPCQNGGVCRQHQTGHTCQCPDGYSGMNCEFFGYDCDSNPCQNGGVCRQRADGGGYQCQCPPGKTSALLNSIRTFITVLP